MTLFDEKIGRLWQNPELSERAKCAREYVLRQFWQSFVDDRFDLKNVSQTKADFSYAIAVVDTIGGWEEEDLVLSRLAACMWINTKAVVCNRQDHIQTYRLLKFRSFIEVVTWVCDDGYQS